MDLEQRIRRDRRLAKEATEEHIKNTEKVRAYDEEYQRILKNIEEETGYKVNSLDEAMVILRDVEADLYSKSTKIEEALRKVGKLT